ncbi:hypothetical protein CG51_01140 [Haematobacter missouriensis]|nr:hypothetical protein CG51_01140 [Haematobacter missouriensis]
MSTSSPAAFRPCRRAGMRPRRHCRRGGPAQPRPCRRGSLSALPPSPETRCAGRAEQPDAC